MTYSLRASVLMVTKGGLDAITLSLASEYAKNNIRFNAVAPGVVDTPLHAAARSGLPAVFMFKQLFPSSSKCAFSSFGINASFD